ncbi:MAG TPA: 30S ribosomal protein S12 methylthiotransferase RimO [Campylobacterales bacterium]|nr:30S ribosomal protein S12 methylthiotransferase RimO [Campylobacterales bacterium]
MKKLYITTLGCTKNLVDSEVMIAKLQTEYQLTDRAEDADLIVVNSCGFIQPAKEESIQTILELDSLRKKDSLLVVSGCLSERYKNELPKELPEVDIWTGVGDYHQIDRLVREKRNSFSPKTYLIKDEERTITGSISHAYIKIGEGCNQRCSFCAIPKFKGSLQSRAIEDILKEVQQLTERGYYDFSFISQDSSSFGRDRGVRDGLVELIQKVDKLENVVSARILYLYPSTTSTNLIQTIATSSKFHNYFDIPLQHISNKMLKIMRRGIDREKTIQLLKEMREVENSFIRTSFIVGHPGESEEDFNELLQFIEDFRFDRITVFQYSNEENTSAYDMEQVDSDEVERRMEQIEKVVKRQFIENLEKCIGKEFPIVLNGVSDEHEYLLSAKALHWGEEIDGEILINDKEIERLEFGKIYRVRITQLAGDRLVGTIVG